MSKAQRWSSVEEDDLTVDNGGGRKRVVGVCSCVCHIRFHAFSSRQTRSENAGMYILMHLAFLVWAI